MLLKSVSSIAPICTSSNPTSEIPRPIQLADSFLLCLNHRWLSSGNTHSPTVSRNTFCKIDFEQNYDMFLWSLSDQLNNNKTNSKIVQCKLSSFFFLPLDSIVFCINHDFDCLVPFLFVTFGLEKRVYLGSRFDYLRSCRTLRNNKKKKKILIWKTNKSNHPSTNTAYDNSHTVLWSSCLPSAVCCINMFWIRKGRLPVTNFNRWKCCDTVGHIIVPIGIYGI